MPVDYADLRAHFTAWIGLPAAEREARLAALRAEAPALAEALGQMFAADAARGRLDDLAEAVAPELLPETLGRFRVLGELGRGGMGVVYLAEQELPRRRVALKTVGGVGAPDERLALFRNEVQAMADLVHPGIPQVYEVFEVAGRLYAAMELVEGVPLLEALERHPALLDRVTLVLRVAEAIAYAHERRVVHRDLKPSNILVSADGVPKVIDWGIARVGEVDGPARSGTLAYVAPEQLAGSPGDPRADVYALGVLAWRTFLGVVPIAVEGLAVEGVLAAKSARPEPPAALPLELRAILRAALAPRAEERYADAGGFAADLRAWLERRPVSAVSPRGLAWSVAFLRRRGRLLARGAGAAAVALALVGAAGFVAAEMVRRDRAHDADQAFAAIRELARRDGADAAPVAAAFAAFVGSARYADTPAVSAAWAWRAEQVDGLDRMAALASAWATSPPENETTTLERLLDALRDAERWPAFARAAALLPPGRRPDLQAQAALVGWDVAGARAALPGADTAVLALLAHTTPFPATTVGALLPGGRALAAQGNRVLLLDAAGERGSVRFPGDVAEIDVRGDRAYVRWEGTENGVSGLDLASFTATPRFATTASIGPMAAGAGDTLYVAQPYPLRRLRRVQGDALAPLGPLDAAELDLHELITADVDGDGAEELVAAGSGWRASDVRVVDAATGHTRARLRMRASSVARLPGAGPTGGLVVTGSPLDRAPFTLGPTALLRLALPDLAIASSVRLPAEVDRLLPVDLDSDGVDDLVLREWEGQGGVGFVRQGADGTLAAPWWLPGASVVAAADGQVWLTSGGRGWLATVAPGGAPLPARDLDRAPAATVVPEEAGPEVHRTWMRLETLAGAGLAEEAGLALTEVGRRELGPVGTAALARALTLLAGAHSTRAVDTAAAILARPDAPAAARDTATATLLAAHRLGPLLDAPAPPEALAPLRALDAAVPLGVPLDARWDPVRPLTILAHPLADAVEVRARTDLGELLALPLDWDGQALDVELDLTAVHLDWSAGVEVGVDVGGVRNGVWLGRVGGGPAAGHDLLLRCDTQARKPVGHPGAPVPLRLGLSWLGGTQNSFACAHDGEPFAVHPTAAPPAGATARLYVTTRADVHADPGLVDVLLRGLRVRGATARGAPEAAGRRAFVSGDAAALATAAASDPSPLVRVLAARAAQGGPAAPAAAALVGLTDADIGFLLRTDAATWAGPARAALGRRFSPVFAAAWALALAYDEADEALRLPALADLPLDDAAGRELALAQARALLSVPARAAEAARLLAALRDRADVPDAWLLTARLRGRAGDAAGARDALARWFALAPSVERAADRARAEPDLAGFVPADLAPAATLETLPP